MLPKIIECYRLGYANGTLKKAGLDRSQVRSPHTDIISRLAYAAGWLKALAIPL